MADTPKADLKTYAWVTAEERFGRSIVRLSAQEVEGGHELVLKSAAQARITALQAELEAALVDAERYRALRASLDSKARRSLHMPQISDPLNSFLLTYTPKGFDDAVDDAMASSDAGSPQ